MNLLSERRRDFHLVYLKPIALAHDTRKLELQPLELGKQLLLREISRRHERRSCFHFSDSRFSNRWKRADHFPEKPAEHVASIAILFVRQSTRLFDRFANARDIRFACQIEVSDTFAR